MGAVRQAIVPILDAARTKRGELHLSVLPRVRPDQQVLWDFQDDPGRDMNLEPVQLLENEEYRYEICLDGSPVNVTTRHDREVFEPDDETGLRGRLRPRLFTGALHIPIEVGGVEVGRVDLEVRAAKLGYLEHYRWMLEDIAAEFTEVVMERFAASEQRFAIDDSGDAQTIYQRFAFLKHLIAGEAFEAAMHQILSRPHRAWVEEEELRPVGRGIPARAAVIRQITGASGPRVPWPGGRLDSLPARLAIHRTEETLDTPENRFVKFALTCWRDLVAAVESVLATEPESSPVARGRKEVRTVLDRLDELLSAPMFTEVGPLLQFPAGSQVLQKRAGYRELFRAYVQLDAAAALTWKGGEDVYSAGQRNVAALYEYWVFLRLRAVVADLCEQTLREEPLFETGKGLTVTLKRGRSLLLEGTATRLGRPMRMELFFNKGFGRGEDGSWTLPMRPDCSLRISTPEQSAAPFEEVWLHFDAKYRIESPRELYGKYTQSDDAYLTEEAQEEEKTGKAKNTDLLKMHAYRDAIKKSAGSYVIFPGDTEDKPFQMYTEILPGLGAFALRPVENGKPDGFDALKGFISDVLDHMSSQATQHERTRYWVTRSTRDDTVRELVPAVPFLTHPPADTRVLLGYVRDEDQLAWIMQQQRYNIRAMGESGVIRADAEELHAEFVLLYSRRFVPQQPLWRVKGSPEVWLLQQMLATNYPSSPGRQPRPAYFCLPVEPVAVEHFQGGFWARVLEASHEGVPKDEYGKPKLVSWLDLIRFGLAPAVMDRTRR